MTQLVVKNEGGPGRFCIMPSAVWPTTNFKVIRQHPKIQMLQPSSVKFDTVIPFYILRAICYIFRTTFKL